MPTPTLRIVPRNGPRSIPAAAPRRGSPRVWTWLGLGALAIGGILLIGLWWWMATAETRAIRALPDEQRLPLYHRTVEDLRNICDPAATRALRDFCHRQAELALRFEECAHDQECTDLARRHLFQPHR